MNDEIKKVPFRLDVAIVDMPRYRPDMTMAEARLINDKDVAAVMVFDIMADPLEIPRLEKGLVLSIEQAPAVLLPYFPPAPDKSEVRHALRVAEFPYTPPAWQKIKRDSPPKMTRAQRRGRP